MAFFRASSSSGSRTTCSLSGIPGFVLETKVFPGDGEEIVDELKKKQRDKTRAEVEELCKYFIGLKSSAFPVRKEGGDHFNHFIDF